MSRVLSIFISLILVVLQTDVAAQVGDADLKQIFDAYNAAALAGDLEGATRLRTSEVRSEILAALRDPSQKADAEAMLKALVPLSYTVDQSDRSGTKAMLYATGTFHAPRGGKTIRQEFIMEFLKEAGAWRLGRLTFTGGDPAKIKRSDDVSLEPESRFDPSKTTSVGGRVIAVAFEPDHTRVTIRVLDDEVLVYLPPKAELQKSGFAVEKLKPGVLIEAEGRSHKTNPRKVLARSARFLKP